MSYARSRRSQPRADYWPGFVDAMASLLLVIIFLLSVFVIAQFFLSQEISGRDTALSRLNNQIAELTQLLQLERGKADDLQDSVATLSATLSASQLDNAGLEAQLVGIGATNQDSDNTISSLATDLSDAEKLSSEAVAQVTLLNQQMSALRRQIAALEDALDASEANDKESRTKISDLGRRLNVALAKRVQDLARYRSDFFGRLRQILGDRSDIVIEGDRFVFQSEVLFGAGEADVSAAGTDELAKLADAILQLEQEIPPEINWVLRIDGHTDSRPISTARFPSNWELSASRAISVAKYLVDRGVSPGRLVAAGFGEFNPIDPGQTEAAYRRNRRIEFKLTE